MSLANTHAPQQNNAEYSNSERSSAVNRNPFFNPKQKFFQPRESIQRKCEECEKGDVVQRQPMEEEEELQMKSMEKEEEDSSVQMSKSESGPNGDATLSGYLNRSVNNGKPLDSVTNLRMSNAFGYDFSKVRIHNDKKANEISQRIGANAFATGNHVYFNHGKYSPGTIEGDRLLSHELTHVVQQKGGLGKRIRNKNLSISKPGDPFEQQADNVSDLVTTALHNPSSGNGSENNIAKNESSSTKISLSDAIIHRKVRNGIPEIQKDGGATVAILGLIVSTASFAAGQEGSHPLTVDPRLQRIAERGEERERYRRANPMKHQSWSFFDRTWKGATPISLDRRWTVDFRWQYNGAELTDVHLVQGWEDFFPSDETHAKVVMVDNQASNKKIGFRCEFEWDPALPGHGVYLCEGWISTDGSASRTPWRWHSY